MEMIPFSSVSVVQNYFKFEKTKRYYGAPVHLSEKDMHVKIEFILRRCLHRSKTGRWKPLGQCKVVVFGGGMVVSVGWYEGREGGDEGRRKAIKVGEKERRMEGGW